MAMFKKIATLISLALCACCSKSPSGVEEARKPLVLTSIAPYQFLAERVAGPDFEVRTIVPSNANPHSFEPTSAQVAEMARASIWFRIGEPFEGKILPYLNKTQKTCDLRDGISLLEGDSSCCANDSLDHYDRHIWLSPKQASLQAALMETALSEKFPEKQDSFKKNLRILQGQLALLDIEIHTILDQIKERAILVSHPAFGYFCKDYGIEQLSIEFEGKDPLPKHLEAIMKQAVELRPEIALALPQYNNKGTQLVAEKLQLPVHSIDPYSADYFKTMRKLAHLIADPSNSNE